MNWQDFEEQVRKIAEAHWNTKAKPETVAGVKCDAVLRISPDEIIVIEITKEKTLSKLRTDLAKFASIRTALVPDGIVVRSYFVSAHGVSSLKETGKAQKVEVLEVKEFREKFVGKEKYEFSREQVEFGSARDPETNKSDENAFIETGYWDTSTGRQYSVSEISDLLGAGKKIVLLGEFGTGKSRCAKEVFKKVSQESLMFPTLAVNLRQHWGHHSFDIIVRTHLSGLGLTELEDRAVKLARGGHLSFILDGFDEIGSQSWSGEPERLREIRRRSLTGVRDLIEKSGEKGILISGRAHYFSNDEEMFSCLGINSDALVLHCPEEFTESQAEEYLKRNTGLTEFPEWSPKKPLICQLFAKLPSDEMKHLIEKSEGEVQFFESTFEAICRRETRIHQSIDASVLKLMLLGLASESRKKNEENEEVTTAEINSVFTKVSGFTPLDEASSILQRLPYLGRVSSGSGNRRFVDEYAKSGLRGISLALAFSTSNKEVAAESYKKPVGRFGAKFLQHKGLIGPDSVKYVNLCSSRGNTQVAADYLVSLVESASESISLAETPINRASIDMLDLSDIEIIGLNMSETFVENIVLDGTSFVNSHIDNSVFNKVIGLTDKNGVPSCFDENCDFGEFSSVENISRISDLPLNDAQKTLIAIVRKLFFQPGSGRMEEALLRGTSRYWDRGAAQKIIAYMQANDIISEVQGNRGRLYIPNRKHMSRMGRLRSLLSNSNDEMWSLVS